MVRLRYNVGSSCRGDEMFSIIISAKLCWSLCKILLVLGGHAFLFTYVVLRCLRGSLYSTSWTNHSDGNFVVQCVLDRLRLWRGWCGSAIYMVWVHLLQVGE